MDDPRIGALIGSKVGRIEDARAVIVGFPSDVGVRTNGGRPGAAGGPAAIRAALHRFTPDARNADRFRDLIGYTADLGDVTLTGDLATDQQTLGDTLAPHLAAGRFVVVLGGGHETTFGHFLGHVGAGQDAAILNFDAHPDVRPLRDGQPHSGSPFRQALEHPSGRCKRYTVAGLQPHTVAAAHLDVIGSHGGTWLWADELDRAALESLYVAPTGPTLVSFDLDALDAAFAPGVSAPAAGGLTPALWLHAARLAGRTASVRSVDVVELNPIFDRDGQTARLAARTVWEALAGFAER